MAGASDEARTEAVRSYAAMIVRRSCQHLGLSLAMGVAILGWYASRNAPRSAFAGVAGVGALLMIYNIIRIVKAREALREPSRLPRFAAEQRRSHLVRGRIYLVGAPAVVIVTWLGMLTSSRSPMDSWAVLIGVTISLAGGWMGWLRVLRRLA